MVEAQSEISNQYLNHLYFRVLKTIC